MKDKIKICYMIHIAWRHIFQRPHILYLQLENDFDTVLIEKIHFKNLLLPKQSKNPQKRVSIFQLPKDGQIKFIRKICDFYNNIIIKHYLNCPVVWVCHPEQFKYIENNYKGKVIYDCMDNYTLLGDETSKALVAQYEKKLIERADIIFATSKKLVELIDEPSKTILVRNGYATDDRSLPIKEVCFKKDYTITYFGSISTWFDFELLDMSLKELNNVKYKIIGPVSSSIEQCYKKDRITFVGPIEHSKLVDNIEDTDVLIMPFVVNDIILAVDPVKLYEYINFGKCIISVWYPEIDRFEPCVYFYKNKKEYVDLLKNLSEQGFPAKFNEKQRRSFLKENSWDARYRIIKTEIDKLFDKGGTFD